MGFTVFFTGLSGAGKTTIATLLGQRLAALTTTPVTVLDGDEIRRHSTIPLGFSKHDRNQNVQRIAALARDVTSDGGIALCAVIAPYDDARQRARRDIERVGEFVLVYVATPLAECERRDPKGLYAKARAGLVENFTGVSDPYEVPKEPDFVLDTTGRSVDESVDWLLARLRGRLLQLGQR